MRRTSTVNVDQLDVLHAAAAEPLGAARARDAEVDQLHQGARGRAAAERNQHAVALRHGRARQLRAKKMPDMLVKAWPAKALQAAPQHGHGRGLALVALAQRRRPLGGPGPRRGRRRAGGRRGVGAAGAQFFFPSGARQDIRGQPGTP